MFYEPRILIRRPANMTGLNVEPVIASETSIQLAISKYFSGSTEIDIFDAAYAVETEKVKGKLAKNGNGNGRNGFAASEGERLHESDLDVSLDRFTFDGTEGDFEVLEENDEIDLAALARASEDAPVVRLVNVLMVDSLRRGASDIHIEPYERDFRIRFRIDGVLYDVMFWV